MANEEHLKILEQGVEAWNKWREENRRVKPDLSGALLRERDLTGADLRRANLTKADLGFANLTEAMLAHAKLTKAVLWEADLTRAYLQVTNLTEAYLVDANLTKADLRIANLTEADLRGANLTEAALGEADMTKAGLRWANLDNADVTDAKMDRHTKCRGIRVATCYGSPKFKRLAQDNDYLEELRSTKKGNVIYWIWLILADCGRSFWPLILWALFFVTCFALVFCILGVDAFEVKNMPHEGPSEKFFTMLYYSVVTFTTLGFGDVTPTTRAAGWWVMAEVVLGYIMLGMLISILANKVARRA